MKLTEIAHFTKNVSGMADFYKILLNVEAIAASEDMAIFMHNGVKIFIHKWYEPAEGDLPPENHHAYTVDNVDSVCRDLANKGMSIEFEAKDYYWGRSAYLRDPDGNLIEITAEAD